MAIGQAESVKPWPWDEPLIGGGSLQACLHTKRLNLGCLCLGLPNILYIYIHSTCSWLAQGKPIKKGCVKSWRSLSSGLENRASSDAISHCLWYLRLLSTPWISRASSLSQCTKGLTLGKPSCIIVPMFLCCRHWSFQTFRFHQILLIQSDAKIYLDMILVWALSTSIDMYRSLLIKILSFQKLQLKPQFRWFIPNQPSAVPCMCHARMERSLGCWRCRPSSQWLPLRAAAPSALCIATAAVAASCAPRLGENPNHPPIDVRF